MFLVYRFNNKEFFTTVDIKVALDSAQESRAQKPSDLLHFCGSLSELLTCIFAGWIVKLNFWSYLFSWLTHCTYFLTSTINWCLLNVKNGLDFAFRHVSNSFTFYITVEECWSKRYVCITYSLGNILGLYLLVNITFLYLVHITLN